MLPAPELKFSLITIFSFHFIVNMNLRYGARCQNIKWNVAKSQEPYDDFSGHDGNKTSLRNIKKKFLECLTMRMSINAIAMFVWLHLTRFVLDILHILATARWVRLLWVVNKLRFSMCAFVVVISIKLRLLFWLGPSLTPALTPAAVCLNEKSNIGGMQIFYDHLAVRIFQ